MKMIDISVDTLPDVEKAERILSGDYCTICFDQYEPKSFIMNRCAEHPSMCVFCAMMETDYPY